MKRKRNLETGIHDLLFLLFFSFALYPHRERKKRKRKKGGKKREKRAPQGGICHVALLPCGLQGHTFTTSLTVNSTMFYFLVSFFFFTRTWPEIEKKGILLIQNRKGIPDSIPRRL